MAVSTHKIQYHAAMKYNIGIGSSVSSSFSSCASSPFRYDTGTVTLREKIRYKISEFQVKSIRGTMMLLLLIFGLLTTVHTPVPVVHRTYTACRRRASTFRIDFDRQQGRGLPSGTFREENILRRSKEIKYFLLKGGTCCNMK